MKIIDKYIIKNFLSNFILYLTVITVLLLLNYIYQLIYSLLVHKISLLALLKLFLYLLPSIFVLAIPVSFLLSLTLTLSTLNETKELLIITTLGVSQFSYLSKLFYLTIIYTIVLTYLNTFLTPKSYKNFMNTYLALITSKPYINFFDGSTVYIQSRKISVQRVYNIENRTLLENIMIYSSVEEHNVIQTIFAKRAYVYNDVYNNLIFDLHNGSCLTLSKLSPETINFLKFDNYRYIIHSTHITKLITRSYSLRELTSAELLSEFNKETTTQQQKRYLLSEFTLRYCLSFSIISFALIGTILGLKIKHSAKSLSFVSTILVVIIYYLLFTGSTAVVENYNIPFNFEIAHLIVQIPNIFLVILSIIIYLILK